MKINLSALKNVVLRNVADVRFVRKRPKPGAAATRRMLCTSNYTLLNSLDGKVTLNYRAPRGGKKVNEQKHNILTVWDILMQDYRCINTEQCDLITTIPEKDFWNYFTQHIQPMAPSEKIGYMNT